MDIKPIPAFYCCYLLRSTKHHSSLYVGSTPNPRRRLAQHNGYSKGGAVRTARNNLRPWEMTCIVTGFPSNVAALQFEWAWQNSHLTRRIADDQRITLRETVIKVNRKTGQTRQRPTRPRMSLMDRISNLHLLLQVPSFCRWPLEVRFFCEDVYQKWQVFSEASKSKVGSNIAVVLDARATNGVLEEPSAAPQKQSATGKGGMEGIEASYAPLKEHLQKSMGLLTEHDTMQCTLCGSSIDDSRRATVCPHDGCTATSHLSCISRHFLEEEKQDSLLPTVGKCPSCRRQTRWVDLVKEVTLRLRGKKEVVSLLKVRKSRVSKKKALVTEPANVSHAEYYSLDDDDEELEEDDEEVGAPYKLDMVDEPHWYEATATMDLDDDDLLSITSAASDAPKFSPQRGLSTSTYRRQDLDIVIEDSDWDSAEVLD